MSGTDLEEYTEGGLAVAKAKPLLKPPRQYKVILLNDDYTPMDFVIEVLTNFFSMDDSRATQVMFQVHTQGKGICGVFTRDIAETKVGLVNEYAQGCHQPLLCQMEPEE